MAHVSTSVLLRMERPHTLGSAFRFCRSPIRVGCEVHTVVVFGCFPSSFSVLEVKPLLHGQSTQLACRPAKGSACGNSANSGSFQSPDECHADSAMLMLASCLDANKHPLNFSVVLFLCIFCECFVLSTLDACAFFLCSFHCLLPA